MKPNKPAVKKSSKQLPAIVRLAWAVDLATTRNETRNLAAAITALRKELDRLESRERVEALGARPEVLDKIDEIISSQNEVARREWEDAAAAADWQAERDNERAIELANDARSDMDMGNQGPDEWANTRP